MQLLSQFGGSDPVSELLGAVRVRSTVCYSSLMRAPWGFGAEALGNPAFHVFTSGHCRLEIADEPQQTELAAGDLVLLPAGPRHWLRDAPDTPARQLEHILATTPLDEHRRLLYGGSGVPSGLLCGGFAHAATLLRTSDTSLAQVAARAGYGTAFSFSKAFKRTFGTAPGEYRGQASQQPSST